MFPVIYEVIKKQTFSKTINQRKLKKRVLIFSNTIKLVTNELYSYSLFSWSKYLLLRKQKFHHSDDTKAKYTLLIQFRLYPHKEFP